MKRRLLNLTAVAWLLLLFIFTVVWLRTYWVRYDLVAIRKTRQNDTFILRALDVAASHGGIGFAVNIETVPWSKDVIFDDDTGFYRSDAAHYLSFPVGGAPGTLMECVGFQFQFAHGNMWPAWRMTPINEHGVFIVAPCWLLSLVLATITGLLLQRVWRNRQLPGHCAACGYDLRGSPLDGACPECGASRPAISS